MSGDEIAQQKAKLFRVRKTVFEMLNDRGYVVKENDLKMTLDDFKEQFQAPDIRQDLTMLLKKKAPDDEMCFVFFPTPLKLGVKEVREFLQQMSENQVKNGIFVVQQPLTSFAKNAMAEFQGKFDLETFQENELLVNIMKHVLVPEHKAMADEEKKALLKRYNLKPSQLPRIQFTDPCARYLGLKRGQVVRIVRSSETAGRYVTYRLVI